MTCVSLKSGVASSGSPSIAQQPKIQASATETNTRNLCSTEKSMMRLIMDGAGGIRSQIVLRLFTEISLALIGAEIVGDAVARQRVAFLHSLGGIDAHPASRIFHFPAANGH